MQKQIDTVVHAAVLAGDAEQDDSEGYALLKDPETRALELKLRAYVLEHEEDMYWTAINRGPIPTARRSKF